MWPISVTYIPCGESRPPHRAAGRSLINDNAAHGEVTESRKHTALAEPYAAGPRLLSHGNATWAARLTAGSLLLRARWPRAGQPASHDRDRSPARLAENCRIPDLHSRDLASRPTRRQVRSADDRQRATVIRTNRAIARTCWSPAPPTAALDSTSDISPWPSTSRVGGTT